MKPQQHWYSNVISVNSRVPPPKRYHPPHSAQYIPPSRASPSESTIPQATTAEDVYRRPARWLGRALWRDTRNKSRSLLSCTRRQFWSPDWAHNNAPADELIGKFLPGAEVDATRRAAPKLGTAVPPHCCLREVPLIRPGIYQRLHIRTPAHCDINHCPLCASAGKRHAVSRRTKEPRCSDDADQKVAVVRNLTDAFIVRYTQRSIHLRQMASVSFKRKIILILISKLFPLAPRGKSFAGKLFLYEEDSSLGK